MYNTFIYHKIYDRVSKSKIHVIDYDLRLQRPKIKNIASFGNLFLCIMRLQKWMVSIVQIF